MSISTSATYNGFIYGGTYNMIFPNMSLIKVIGLSNFYHKEVESTLLNP